jgi:tyrosine-protein kinase Etk/Wzc
MAKLDEARQGALIQVVDPAIPPDRRSSPKRALIILGAALVGFFMAVCWVFITAALENVQKNLAYKGRIEELRGNLLKKSPNKA